MMRLSRFSNCNLLFIKLVYGVYHTVQTKSHIVFLEPGRIEELLEALDTMAKDGQTIPPRAMILSRKYRTLVSSWIEPLQEEAELGYEIDYIARYAFQGLQQQLL